MYRLNKNIYLILPALIIFSTKIACAGEIFFTGNQKEIYEIKPEKTTGLESVFVLYTTEGVTINYQSESPSIEWLTFSSMGGGYAEPVNNVVKEGNIFSLSNIEGNRGFIINDSGLSISFWVTNYSSYKIDISSIDYSNIDDCNETVVNTSGVIEPIYYYTINGRREVLSRDIILGYYTQIWNEEIFNFETIYEEKILQYIDGNIIITPPIYTSTSLMMEYDRFLNFWGMGNKIESTTLVPNAVDVRAIAEEEKSDSSNQITTGNDNNLGGSAPARIFFYSFTTDAVSHYEWQIADDSEFNYIDYRFNDPDINYTFTEEGTKYVRFIGSNYNGTCESISDIFTVTIGGSELLIPNAFSPNDDGINDEWKVSYRSLIEFKCWIYDSHGHELFHFEDPSQGWDGKRNGKVVKPGVYYYVINAKGADGQIYKKSGDINILIYTGSQNTGSEY